MEKAEKPSKSGVVAEVPSLDVQQPSSKSGDPLKYLGLVLATAVRQRASDIHFRAKNHPVVRIDSTLRPLRQFPVLSVTDMEVLAKRIMSPRHWEMFERDFQVDLSFGLKGIGRVRVNAYYQRGTVAMALRVINTQIPTPDDLHLPPMIKDFTRFERGLVLLTGATGSGKSTTLASLINEINFNYAKHIITIEDPVEYIFRENRCLISQRELGVDATTFAMAMKAALRMR